MLGALVGAAYAARINSAGKHPRRCTLKASRPHRAVKAGWRANVDPGLRNIPCGNRAGADGDPRADGSLLPVGGISRGAAGLKQVIHEHNAMGDKALIADRDPFAYKGVGLDPRALADRGAPLNLNEWPNKGPIAYRAAVQVGRLDNRYPLPEGDVLNSDMK